MMTISYEYEGALYVNLTNRCDCACVFCLRRNGHKGSIYADNLWLEHEPTRQEALDNLLARDFSQYRELVFCGFGARRHHLHLPQRLHAGGVLRRHQAPPGRAGVGRHAGLCPGVPGVRAPRGHDHRGQGQDAGGDRPLPQADRGLGRYPSYPGLYPLSLIHI